MSEWSTRTFGNEDRLPRVPLPGLDETCERFLAWCAPLLTAEQLAETADAVAAFRHPDGPGPRLHAALAAFDATDGVHSWLDAFWPARYLGRRDRIALNANFIFLFTDPFGEATTGQVGRAAGLIAATLYYKQRLDAEEIPAIVQRGQALSMEQNKYLFSETRVPGVPQDTVRVPYSPQWPGPSRERHIGVYHRGNLFRMEVLDADGRPYTMDDLAAGLREVLEAGARRDEYSPGHLTTKARAEWAQSRAALIAAGNAEAVETLETALFLVCLDDVAPVDALEACDRLLYADSGSRWFDKSVSLIVFADGQAGINVEHCGLDGTTILSFVDTILAAPSAEQSARSGARSSAPAPVSPVRFVLDHALRADIASAAASFAEYGANTASLTLSFTDFGTDRAKALGMSPDAFVQLAYQLAHRRAKGHIGATYESIATRHFRRGRTEAMRVVTPEVLTFVSTMEDPGATVDERRASFRAAAAAHVVRAKQCQAGEAPEQHLWELLLIQQRRGAELGVTEAPALFATPGWTVMRDDFLSTSSAPSSSIQYFGFGSTSKQCIGVAYVLRPDRFNLYLSTPRPVAAGLTAFADQLRSVITELESLLS